MWLPLAIGCAPPVPTASVSEVALTGVGLREAEAELRVALHNPWPVELPVAGLRYAVEVDGHPLVSGERAPGAALAAGATTVVALPVTVVYADLLAAAGSDAETSVVRATVEVGLDTPAGPLTLPLSWSATTPRFDPPSVEVLDTALGFEAGDVVVGVELRVDLPLGAEVTALGWSATLNGTRLGSGEALVAKGGHLALPLRLDPRTTAGAAVWTALGRPSTLSLELDGTVATALGEVPLRLVRDLPLGQP